MANQQVDVLIVGYGPVGAALACLLGRYGVRTLVVDKSTDIFMAPRAIALDNEALRILQMAGLAEDAFDKVAIPYVRMHWPHVGEFARINTAGTHRRSSEAGHVLPTGARTRVARATPSGTRRVTRALGVEMIELRRTTSDVGARHAARRRTARSSIVTARYLIGADGASSRVRAADRPGVRRRDLRARTGSSSTRRRVPRPLDHVEFLCDPRRPTPHMVGAGRARPGGSSCCMPARRARRWRATRRSSELLRPWAQRRASIRIERKAVYRFHARSCGAVQHGARLPRRRRRAHHTAVRGTGARRRAARRGEPGVEARVGARRARAPDDPRQLRHRATAAREGDDRAREVPREADHAEQHRRGVARARADSRRCASRRRCARTSTTSASNRRTRSSVACSFAAGHPRASSAAVCCRKAGCGTRKGRSRSPTICSAQVSH